jgi:hypothetical protein
LIAVLGVFALAACTDEKIVYRDQPAFNPPPDSINCFLGYFTASTKQTTCGNCHVGAQGDWASTKHAQAWSDLQLSGHATGSCNACHSVSQLGNFVGHPAGYSTVADSAYHDVQCENCHGPGLTHVENPDIESESSCLDPCRHVISSCSGCIPACIRRSL